MLIIVCERLHCFDFYIALWPVFTVCTLQAFDDGVGDDDEDNDDGSFRVRVNSVD